MKLTGKKKEMGISGNVSISVFILCFIKKKNPNLSRKKWDYLRMKELEENT